MRILLVILASATVLCAQAQTHLPIFGGGFGFTPLQAVPLADGFDNYVKTNKWQLKPSTGLSAGYIFYNGGISYVSAPLALTLYHPLTNNITAFGGVYAAPTVFSVRSLYATPPMNGKFSGNPFSQSYGLGINAGIQGGLMYTNDAHTFSISGSVMIQQGSVPVYYPSQGTSNVRKQ